MLYEHRLPISQVSSAYSEMEVEHFRDVVTVVSGVEGCDIRVMIRQTTGDSVFQYFRANKCFIFSKAMI